MFSKRIILAIMLLLPQLILAQEDDFNFWTVVDLSKEINNWEFAGEIEMRQSGFFDKALRYSFQPDISYSIIKHLKVGASYALMSVYDLKYDDYQWRNRYAPYVEGRIKINRFTLRLREKWELTTKDESDRIRINGEIDTYRINPEQVWRNKLKVTYNVPKIPLVPGIAVETFYQLNNPDGNELEKVRYSLFLAYKLDKKNSVEVFSHINAYLNEAVSRRIFILGAAYSYSF